MYMYMYMQMMHTWYVMKKVCTCVLRTCENWKPPRFELRTSDLSYGHRVTTNSQYHWINQGGETQHTSHDERLR